MAESQTFAEKVLANYKLATDSYSNQLNREIADLQFQVPELQWSEESRAQRGGGPSGAIPARPMLTIPKLQQPIQLILNQERSARLGVNIHPLSEDADDDTAEVIQGLYRKIERDSNAGVARSWAFERAVSAGRGVYRVNTRYDDAGGHPFDQKITIERILHQSAVKFDPSAQEADYSDGEFAFVCTWMPVKTFKRLYPTSDAAQASSAIEFEELTRETPDWVKSDGDTRAILVCEYFEKEHETETIAITEDYEVMRLDDVPKGVKVLQTRDRDVARVMWHKLAPGAGGLEEIEPAQEWNGKWIPLIPVIGRELQPFDSERRWTGVIGPAKDAQRLYNYAASTAVEVASLEPKAPWLVAEGQIEGHEKAWQESNVRNYPVLQYKQTDASGAPAPRPERIQASPDKLGPSMTLLQQADEFIQSTTFTPDPALGNLNSRDRSGKAIQALQGQSDASTSHFMHSLSQISMMYEAKVILDMIPRIYDRTGRVAQILGIDEEPRTVMLNALHTMGPDGRPRQMPAQGPQMPPGVQQGGAAPNTPKAKVYDLTKGSYGVSVSIGKSWQTRLQQGSDEIGQILQSSPELMPLIGPIYFKFRDFPGAQEISDILKKVQQQQYPMLKDEEAPDDVDALKAQLVAGKQQMEQMKQDMDAMQRDLALDKAKADVALQKAEMEGQIKLQLAQLETQKDAQKSAIETRQAVEEAQIKAEVEAQVAEQTLEMEQKLQVMRHEFEMEQQAQAQRFEALQKQLDRQHEKEMAQRAAVSAELADRRAEKDESEDE